MVDDKTGKDVAKLRANLTKAGFQADVGITMIGDIVHLRFPADDAKRVIRMMGLVDKKLGDAV